MTLTKAWLRGNSMSISNHLLSSSVIYFHQCLTIFRNGSASSVMKFQICRSQVATELTLLLLTNALITFLLRICNSSPILVYCLLKLFSKTNRKHQKYPNLPANSVFSSFLMLLLHLILFKSSLLLKCFHEWPLR